MSVNDMSYFELNLKMGCIISRKNGLANPFSEEFIQTWEIIFIASFKHFQCPILT